MSTQNTQGQDGPPLAKRSGSARVWTCDQCGLVGQWTGEWSTWGSIHEDEAGRRLVVCSPECRSAADPEALWLRKFGEAPRKFRSSHGGNFAMPCANGARPRKSPNAPASAAGQENRS